MEQPSQQEMIDNLKSLLDFFQDKKFEYCMALTLMLSAIEMIASYTQIPPQAYDDMLDALKNEYRKSWKQK